MDEGTKTLVDASELARIVGLPTASVRRLARQGELPSYRLGRLLRFSPVEVLAAMKDSNHSKEG
jgi:excisionase family DNA binding protein